MRATGSQSQDVSILVFRFFGFGVFGSVLRIFRAYRACRVDRVLGFSVSDFSGWGFRVHKFWSLGSAVESLGFGPWISRLRAVCRHQVARALNCRKGFKVHGFGRFNYCLHEGEETCGQFSNLGSPLNPKYSTYGTLIKGP